ncbi:thioredoxin family protein [Marinomonas fungiae]|uniref:Thioredoxin n=1 Tax=Marinomonas fungiae TaxID=1137284 RepID=A0A0K6IMK0_9GAMM|nr:thioredoxin family protein [Marinomonas fungiae]CUB04323.1 Thioredoxin [Marinomonas fungiae]
MTDVVTGFNATYSEDDLTLEQITALEGDVVLEFGTSWCGYCKRAQPLIEEVMDDFTDVGHVKIFDGQGKPVGRHFQVKLWPTLILLHNGEEVGRVVRPDSADELRRLLDL